jgi:hypothetical protein
MGELDDQIEHDAQQHDPIESTSAFEREMDAKSGPVRLDAAIPLA